MNKERKRYLKKEGKKIVEAQSEKLKIMLKESNPANIGSSEWAYNYKYISIREQKYRTNRSKIYPKEMIGVEFLLNAVSLDLTKYFPVQGYYLHCLKCGDLLPMNPINMIRCQCDSVQIDPNNEQAFFDLDKTEVVNLIAIANSNRFKNILKKVKHIFNCI